MFAFFSFRLFDILKCESMIEYFATTKNIKIFQLLKCKWFHLKEIVYVLRILYGTTVAFQNRKLTLSDVYGLWTTAQLYLKECSRKKSYKTGPEFCNSCVNVVIEIHIESQFGFLSMPALLFLHIGTNVAFERCVSMCSVALLNKRNMNSQIHSITSV